MLQPLHNFFANKQCQLMFEFVSGATHINFVMYVYNFWAPKMPTVITLHFTNPQGLHF